MDPIGLGAYGIRLRGLDGAADLLVDVAPEAPEYAVEAEIGHAEDGGGEHVGERDALLRLRSGGDIRIEPGRMRFRVPHPVRDDELVHPYLAPAAAVAARWRGHESMHAGAFAVGGVALGIVGTREAGKSSTLAWLATRGADVLCDDMLVVEGERPVMGPRSIDLREDAAGRLGVGEAIGVTGARERWRLRLAPAAEGATLRGWVFLSWGDTVAARPLPGSERLPRLAAERGLRLPPVRPDALLELTSLPAWEVSRPRGWDSLPATAELLLELASARPTGAA